MKKLSTSLYGYNKKEVSKFVSDVANKYETMLNNLKNRDNEIKKLTEQVEYYKNLEGSFNKALYVAEDTSKQMRKFARDESASIINEAKRNASRIINDALLKSEKIEEESQRLKMSVNRMKKRLRQTLEEELAIIDDIDDIDY